MLQVIGGKTVFVVDFDTMPELPITGLTTEEESYNRALYGWNNPQGFGAKTPPPGSLAAMLMPSMTYARALNHALETGVITEPGKYGIYLKPGTPEYEIYTIAE